MLRRENVRKVVSAGLAVDAVDERFESLRSKLVPYGLLSSSFHMMHDRDSFQERQLGKAARFIPDFVFDFEALKMDVRSEEAYDADSLVCADC